MHANFQLDRYFKKKMTGDIDQTDLTLRSIGKVETLRSQKSAFQYSENKNIVLLQGFGGCPFIL